MNKLIIIGAGPAGLTAAIYAARANLSPIVIEGDIPGGQLTWTTVVENFPGFPQGVDGPELMMNMRKQAEKFGANFISGTVVQVNFINKPFTIKTQSNEFKAESVIIASGASARKLGLSKENEFIGHGLHTCATCDGAFYKDKKVALVGGGDAAMEEAIFLTKFAQKVQIIHRKDKLNASLAMQERAKNNSKIEFIWNTEIVELIGESQKLEAVKLKNTVTGELSELKLDGLFLAIGHIPNTESYKGQLEFDQKDYLKVTDFTKSSVPGVFIAGDVCDWRYRQAITAAGLGCMAALDAEKYLMNKE